MANCISQPSGVRISGQAMTPALLMRMCSGPFQAAANVATEAWSARSSRATSTCLLPVPRVMSAAIRSPASTLRTASVTEAPAPASARAVSTPMPDAPPVTMARRPVRSMPSTTSAAVDSAVNGVVMGVLTVMLSQSSSALRVRYGAVAPSSLARISSQDPALGLAGIIESGGPSTTTQE